MKKLLFFLLLLIPISVFSQNTEIVVKLLDKENNTPVEGASITVLPSKQGLVSNSEGVFKLFTKKPVRLQISHASFETLIVNTSSLTEKENIIYLDRTNKFLEEVIVTKNHPQEILKKVVKTSIENLTVPVNLKVYTREFFKKNDKYTSFNDGLLNFCIQGNPKNVKTDILVEQNRFYGLLNEDFQKKMPLGYNLNDLINNYYEFRYLNRVIESSARKKYDYEIKTFPGNRDWYMMKIYPLKDVEEYLADFTIVYDYQKNIIIEIHSAISEERYDYANTTDFNVVKGKIYHSIFNAVYKYDGKDYYLSSSNEEIGFSRNTKKKETERIEVKNYFVTTQFDKKMVPYDKDDVYKDQSLNNKRNSIITNYWEMDSGLTLTDDERKIIEDLATKL
ncbi:carboxypeptidase-like regulatory domain-containing protein [Flavobacterium sp. SM15]|uniref:carboxypeptidase-like regulatory domain-containing protein n=1 Tax=Flavobacterium sp. SM15 TaxID=2908005 RepID=UPI001EDC4F7D|nr:carboxypeptidase-like regulatory domain-containing protein [Flavobacterium sp. SM15]MCG2611446.1 carboxypeptidase-like regulatory domain-containing protein [Flavobacterium sp. SM15]